jgi:hypothetical protein
MGEQGETGDARAANSIGRPRTFRKKPQPEKFKNAR